MTALHVRSVYCSTLLLLAILIGSTAAFAQCLMQTLSAVSRSIRNMTTTGEGAFPVDNQSQRGKSTRLALPGTLAGGLR